MTQAEIDTLMNQSWAEVWRGFLQRRAEDKKEKERLAQLEQDLLEQNLRAAYGAHAQSWPIQDSEDIAD